MKGVILAGGNGKRLWPITKVTNKHLLPVYNRPMIYYPLATLVASGIKDILVVCGGEHVGHFVDLLGPGKEFGVRLSYEVQERAGGIADALSYAEDFADNDSMMVILGDNIFEDTFERQAAGFVGTKQGASVFCKSVPDAHRFAVAEVKNNKIISLEEKPKKPKSDLVTTGLYMYHKDVFDIIRTLKPSGRGELEITDVNNVYLQRGLLSFEILRGAWADAGTFDSLLRAGNFIAQYKAHYGA